MNVVANEMYRMRDGRIVIVTDAAEPGPYETIARDDYFNKGIETVTSSMPTETIFVGTEVTEVTVDDKGLFHPAVLGGTVVSDMSEVVAPY